MMWRCLSDLGGQSDLWSDVDTRRTGGGSLGAWLGRMVPCGTIFGSNIAQGNCSTSVLDVLPMAHQPSETRSRKMGQEPGVSVRCCRSGT